MGVALKQAGLLSRSVARIIDLLLAAAMMETIPKAGFYIAIMYVLTGDGFFNRASVGKKLMGLVVNPVGNGYTLPVRDSILRNLSLALAIILWRIPIIGWFLFLGIVSFEFIIMLGSSERKRIGDELAATKVLEIINENINTTNINTNR
jgi:uncharacterized RDD family membrane protein YckC